MFPPPTFFPDEKFNLAEFILRGREDGKVAIHFIREGKPGVEHVTWSSLRQRTAEAYDAMVSSDVRPGDIVAVVMANSVDTIVLALATLSIGAVWASASPELGVQAIVDRYDQLKPAIIFTDDAYIYAGKTIVLQDRIESWSKSLAAHNEKLVNVVVLAYCGGPVEISRISRGISWDDFRQRKTGRELSFLQSPFSHPAFILFSSGTVRGS
jgi:acetoacetyl-CoA synthetase